MGNNWKGIRVEMITNDGWANPGWTGIVSKDDITTVVVRWDNGRQYNHLKNNLRMISITSHNDPNAAFVLHKRKVM